MAIVPEARMRAQLLLKVHNNVLMDYFYFPDVVRSGRHLLSRAEFEFLQSEDFLQRTHCDSFGCFYTLSQKGEAALHRILRKTRQLRHKKAPLQQGCFYFNRSQGGHAQGARCLLFF